MRCPDQPTVAAVEQPELPSEATAPLRYRRPHSEDILCASMALPLCLPASPSRPRSPKLHRPTHLRSPPRHRPTPLPATSASPPLNTASTSSTSALSTAPVPRRSKTRPSSSKTARSSASAPPPPPSLVVLTPAVLVLTTSASAAQTPEQIHNPQSQTQPPQMELAANA